MSRGRFITLEGGEGAGKSTQQGLLAARIRSFGLDIVETREPGGTPPAERIRDLLVEGAANRWDPVSETLLHFAARREHLLRTIDPELKRGAWVLCDRFADSTRAYQGYGMGVPMAFIEALYDQIVGDMAPDLTLILDIPVDEGLRRAGGRGAGGTRYERMDPAFHQRLRDGFLAIARNDPRRCAVVDATGTMEEVAARIASIVEKRLHPAAP